MLPFELTKDTPYLALSGELWSVFYEYFTEIDRVIKGFYCISQMSLQLSCGGTCQIGIQFKESNMYLFARLKISVTEKLTNGDLVTPTPGLIQNRQHGHIEDWTK